MLLRLHKGPFCGHWGADQVYHYTRFYNSNSTHLPDQNDQMYRIRKSA